MWARGGKPSFYFSLLFLVGLPFSTHYWFAGVCRSKNSSPLESTESQNGENKVDSEASRTRETIIIILAAGKLYQRTTTASRHGFGRRFGAKPTTLEWDGPLGGVNEAGKIVAFLCYFNVVFILVLFLEVFFCGLVWLRPLQTLQKTDMLRVNVRWFYRQKVVTKVIKHKIIGQPSCAQIV